MPTVEHEWHLMEYADGSAFTFCPCGWTSRGYGMDADADAECVSCSEHDDDNGPPWAIVKACNEGYGHIYRTGRLGLDA